MVAPRRDQPVRSLGKKRSSVRELAKIDAVKPPAEVTIPIAQINKPKVSNGKKNLPRLHILDTNVLMHDPLATVSFQEHGIAILSIVLQELDNNKKGNGEPNRCARATSRLLNEVFSPINDSRINTGVSLVTVSKGKATGSIFIHSCDESDTKKPDDVIVATTIALRDQFKGRKYSEVVLVSKDINVRLKAKALGIVAEDYLTDKTIEDSDILPSGTVLVKPSFLETVQNVSSYKKDGHVFYQAPIRFKLSEVDIATNEFLSDGEQHLQVISRGHEGILLRVPTDHSKDKNSVYGITARNNEQNFALNLLMNPNVDFITLLGMAGTGKTLLTLAAALHQTLEMKLFSEIIITRVTIPMGEDIGFLPGTEEEKMTPWMGALEDNLEVLNKPCEVDEKNGKTPNGWGRAATMDLIRSRIKIKSLNFMRGRTFHNKFLIIDEAQNLTPKQMKALITRAGPGTKVVCMGNLSQIDSPFISEGSSGLTYAVERFRGWPHSGNIALQKGERSRLADHANEVL
ncbi:PhoH family protein [Candidatus Gracilibacteria bacterium]|nr:PhoH family protein [Candidatus Gracilibacteria bacterium]